MTSTPKRCKAGQRCQPVTLREALYCQVHHSELRLDAIARHLALNAGTLADAVNPDGDGSILASKHYQPLLELTRDNLSVVAFLASLQRAVVYAMPTGDGTDMHLADVVREFGEFLTRHAEARAVRGINITEAAEIEREGQDAIRAILTVIDEAKREAATPPAGTFVVYPASGGAK
jgi:hypothetical protein